MVRLPFLAVRQWWNAGMCAAVVRIVLTGLDARDPKRMPRNFDACFPLLSASVALSAGGRTVGVAAAHLLSNVEAGLAASHSRCRGVVIVRV
jgi:hypothetical protein